MKVDPPADLLTPQQRIGWAIQWAKAHKGITPQALADKCGVTRPGLLNWTSSDTNIDKVGIGALRAFCAALDLDLEWLLSGAGQAWRAPITNKHTQRIVDELRLLAREEPAEYSVIVKMIHAAADGVRRGDEEGTDQQP
jgi:transcriptional regulator with XRE-family HTH domain